MKNNKKNCQMFTFVSEKNHLNIDKYINSFTFCFHQFPLSRDNRDVKSRRETCSVHLGMRYLWAIRNRMTLNPLTDHSIAIRINHSSSSSSLFILHWAYLSVFAFLSQFMVEFTSVFSHFRECGSSFGWSSSRFGRWSAEIMMCKRRCSTLFVSALQQTMTQKRIRHWLRCNCGFYGYKWWKTIVCRDEGHMEMSDGGSPVAKCIVSSKTVEPHTELCTFDPHRRFIQASKKNFYWKFLQRKLMQVCRGST